MLPTLLWVVFFLTGIDVGLYDSFNRVANPKTAYAPPALFSFHLETKNLDLLEGGSNTVLISTKGDFVPEEVKIQYDHQTYFMQEVKKGVFSFTFTNLTKSLTFQCYSGEVYSEPYFLNVIKTPLIQNLEISLDYPAHTQIKDEIIQNTGNLTVPVGTKNKMERFYLSNR